MQILHPKWIVPIIPRQTVIENHSLIITDNKITAISPTATAKKLAGHHIDLSDHILMPGLINAHTHVPMNLFRSYADDLHLDIWLKENIWPIEEQFLSPELCYEGALLAIAEMIKGGTTCFNDMYFFTTKIAQAALDSGVRAAIGINIFDFPTIFAKNADECLLYAKDQIQMLGNNPLIQTTLAPHAPYTVNDQELKKIVSFAEQHNLKINMHIHETAKEITDSITQYGVTPLQRLNKLGFLSSNLIAMHMTQLNDDDLKLLVDNQVNVVHCPESNLKLASGFCNITCLLNRGVNVALGTDSAASNNDLDMFTEMRLAALLAKGITGDPTNMPAHATLEIATINGAKALGIDHKVGSIEVGKDADVIAIHVERVESMPNYNQISQLVYATNSQQVTDVWVAGKRLLDNRKLLSINENDLRAIARKWQSQIAMAKKG